MIFAKLKTKRRYNPDPENLGLDLLSRLQLHGLWIHPRSGNNHLPLATFWPIAN